MDMGCHMFDILIGLFGMPQAVFADCPTLVQEYGVEDSSVVTMTYTDGAQVMANFGWNSKTWTHEFEVVGSEAKVKWFPADTGKVIVTRGREIEEIELNCADNVHTPLIADFNAAVAEGRKPVCPLGEAVKTNVLLDAAYRSSSKGEIVTLC